MKDTRYAFCTARLRALENRLLTKDDIASLINQKNLSAALSFLVHKGYAEENESINRIAKRHTEELNTALYESVPDKKELDALYILNDYFNLKVLVKCIIEKADPCELYIFPTTIDTSVFAKNVTDDDLNKLRPAYSFIAKEAYSLALKSENGKFSDMLIDKAAINALTAYSKSKNSGILGKICGFLADTANIKTALRCIATAQDEEFIKEAIGDCAYLDKEILVSSAISGKDSIVSYLQSTVYGKGLEIYLSKPSDFEKWCDDTVAEIASDAVYTSFGFDPAVDYFYRKSLEIKTVRMILNAVKSDIDRSIIKERLRKHYA